MSKKISLEFYLGVLPGLEKYTVPPAPPENNKNAHTHRDLYNLRLLNGAKSCNLTEVPQLGAWSPTYVSKPIAFHEARAYYRKYRTLKGYFVHFYIDDVEFECVRKHPEKYVDMFKSADFIISPDFSTYRNYPLPVLFKNAFDNLLLGAYYQREDCNVVANAVWGKPIFYNLTFSGQPIGGTICVSSKAINLRDKKGIQFWLHGYKEAISRLRPYKVIRIGKIIPGEDAIYPNAIHIEVVSPYIKRMRHGR